MLHALTNPIANEKAIDFKIHIYKTRVMDVHKRHQQNYALVNELAFLNNRQIIAYFEKYIASFHSIKNWGHHSMGEHECRSIDPTNPTERELLERLLLKEIERTSFVSRYYNALHGEFLIKQESVVGDLSIRGCLTIQCKIDTAGKIYFGCDYSHRFSKRNSIVQSLYAGKIQEGHALVDRFRKEYQFIRVSHYTIHDRIESWGQSIFEYYQNRKEGKILEKVPPDTKVIVVKTNHNDQELYFAPQLLFEKCSFDNIPITLQRKVNQIIKMSADKKMNLIIKHSMEILNACEYIRVDKKGFLAQEQGYQIVSMQNPTLLFGQNQEHLSPGQGLTKHGVHERIEEPLKVNFIVDDRIYNHMIRKGNSYSRTFKEFVITLINFSDQLNVPIEQVKIGHMIDYSDFIFSDPMQLRSKLRRLSEHLQYTTVILLDKQNKDAYQILKQELSGKAKVPIQVIFFDTIQFEDSRKYSMLNILLGIYAKSGIQPWVLKSPLAADCYIGLDVSHDEGKHSTGIVQVVGGDGRILASNAIRGTEAGEIISKQTFEVIIHEALFSYEETYGMAPKHFVFHRDGKGFENELNTIKEIMRHTEIMFDYVAIKKNVNRRMATISREQNTWTTKQGTAFIKGREAYMCTTNPRDTVGMADPIKIEYLYGNRPITEIIKEIYNLSFMHIGAINKSRLPVTTHYADKSSTFYNRGMLPIDGKDKVLYFI